MSRTHGHSVDIALAVLLDALAPVLLALDITPSHLSQAARAAFVKAGASQARTKHSGRPHLARIAALTGLTRLEVKRLVTSNYRTEPSSVESLPRAMRVLSGWRSSKTYSTRGKPRPLRIAGEPPNFQSLCKTFSGDIPYRVILDELERRQCILVSRKRNQVTVARPTNKIGRNPKDHAALVFAASFLNDALRNDLVVVRRKEKIATSRQLPDAYVEAAVASRITDLLDQLPQLYVGRKTPRRNIMNIFALVSRNKRHR